jgi:putative ABC transport system permease protein
MRSLGLATRLAWRNLRRRPGQALLLLLTLTIATGTLGVSLTMLGSADGPWDRVWRTTSGFHVGAIVYHPPDEPGDRELVARQRREAVALAKEPGVVAVGGPWTHLYGSIDIGDGSEDLTAEIRDPAPSDVDQPLVTAGQWLGDAGGVVLESGLASTIPAGPGDVVTIQGRPFTVRGVAMTVSRGRFPLSRPAQVWVTPRTARALRDTGATPEGFAMQLRLRNPNDAGAFVAAHGSFDYDQPSSSVTASLETWQHRRGDSHSDLDILAGTLFIAGTLVAVLTIATAAVLVAGRMAAQIRQVGTLKAIGVTPRQVVLTLLVEYMAVAAVATAIGLAIGRVIAPRLAETSVTILGSPQSPPLTLTKVLIVAGVAFSVVVLATLRPGFRGIRHSTLRSLVSGARSPKRPARMARTAESVGAPPAIVLGLRSAWRRPGRLLTNATGLALAVAMIVVAVGLRESLDLLKVAPPEPGHAASDAAVEILYEQIRAIVIATAFLLMILGAINAFIVATFAARDSARNHAVVRAVGGTPRQTITALIVSQLGACVVAVAVGIPLGLGMWSLMAGGDLPEVNVSGTSLVLLAVAVPLVFSALVSIPARMLARQPVTQSLAYE